MLAYAPHASLLCLSIALVCCGTTSAQAQGAPTTPTWPDISGVMETADDGSQDTAVIVGLERYDRVPAVAGAEQNAKDWYRWLTGARKVPRRNVKLLINGDATREDIELAVKEMSAKAKGTFWFVFIGHGTPIQNGADAGLVGVDVRQKAVSLKARSVSRAWLLDRAKATPAQAAVVVLDACFNGRAQAKPLVPNLQPLVPNKQAKAPAKVALLTAGKSDQFAGPLDGQQRPAFSYLILGAMRGWADGRDGAKPDGKVTAQEAWAYAADALTSLRDRKQEPTLDGLRGLALATGPAERGPNLDTFILGPTTKPKPTTTIPKATARPATTVPVPGLGPAPNTSAVSTAPNAPNRRDLLVTVPSEVHTMDYTAASGERFACDAVGGQCLLKQVPVGAGELRVRTSNDTVAGSVPLTVYANSSRAQIEDENLAYTVLAWTLGGLAVFPIAGGSALLLGGEDKVAGGAIMGLGGALAIPAVVCGIIAANSDFKPKLASGTAHDTPPSPDGQAQATSNTLNWSITPLNGGAGVGAAWTFD